MTHLPRRIAAATLAASLLTVGVIQPATAAPLAPCGPGAKQVPGGDVCVSRRDARGKKVVRAVRNVRTKQQTRATLFAVHSHGRLVAEGAMGKSLTHVPARRNMHFRIGNTTETLTTTLLLQLVDRGRVRLKDKVSRWFPDFPNAREITLGMLARSTSGIPDYVRVPAFSTAQDANPFRHWLPQELLAFIRHEPLQFRPGTNWAFSDSNFVLLGMILEKAVGRPVPRQLRTRILRPLGLDDTRMMMNGLIQDPPLHAFTHERGPYEESTFWDPTWAMYTANMTSNLHDMSVWARALGRGTVVSRRSHRLQTGLINVGLGPNTKSRHYAMGVGVTSGWILANPQLLGFNGIVAYNPKRDLSVVVSSTQNPHNSETIQYSTYFFRRIAKVLTGVVPNISPDPRPHG